MINIISSSRYKINRKIIKQSFDDQNSQIVNIVFIGKNKMRQISKKYKGENEALPVLSFSYLENSSTIKKSNDVIGEVFICYPQAVLLAAERNKKVDDIILFLIKHGIENIL